jgi:hypothetical protein
VEPAEEEILDERHVAAPGISKCSGSAIGDRYLGAAFVVCCAFCVDQAALCHSAYLV